MTQDRIRHLVAAAVVASGLAAGTAARAQTVCATPNCAFGATPTACQKRAAPRTPTVVMAFVGVNPMFDPQNPKIEPGDCVIWKATDVTHSSSDNHCTDDLTCGAPPVAGCLYDTGDVASASATPTSTCFYDPAVFPPQAANAFYCRIHASPTTGTMRGTLRVTTAIALSVNKDLATNSVKLTWTGGGVTGDISYKVERNGVGDPTFPAATTTTLNPDAGVLGTTFTDTGDLLNASARFYLVRNKQTNEP